MKSMLWKLKMLHHIKKVCKPNKAWGPPIAHPCLKCNFLFIKWMRFILIYEVIKQIKKNLKIIICFVILSIEYIVVFALKVVWLNIKELLIII